MKKRAQPFLLSLLVVLLLATTSTAQTNKTPYADSLGKGLSILLASVKDTCKVHWGKRWPGETKSYVSKMKLPRSYENRFDIAPFVNYPIIFLSSLPAGNDRKKADIDLRKLKMEIDSVTVKYQGKEYPLQYLAAESKTAENPDFQYKLLKAPKELDGLRIYIRLADAPYGVDFQYQYTMGFYIRKDYE
jgi:hypothetical protein